MESCETVAMDQIPEQKGPPSAGQVPEELSILQSILPDVLESDLRALLEASGGSIERAVHLHFNPAQSNSTRNAAVGSTRSPVSTAKVVSPSGREKKKVEKSRSISDFFRNSDASIASKSQGTATLTTCTSPAPNHMPKTELSTSSALRTTVAATTFNTAASAPEHSTTFLNDGLKSEPEAVNACRPGEEDFADASRLCSDESPWPHGMSVPFSFLCATFQVIISCSPCEYPTPQ